ncbi:MAG: DNA-processing protein DprA [Clostridia bacterium]|nr:DNA-processing protein DprA [Clostridia bacterium]
MDNILYWVWLSEICSPSTAVFKTLFTRFGSIEKIYDHTFKETEGFSDIPKRIIQALNNKSTDRAEKIIKTCQKKNIGILTYSDTLYSARLRNIQNPPVLLYYKGELPSFDESVCIGTVGTRTPTDYGKRCAYEFIFDMTLGGACIVSGMASGIDAVCHTAALDAGGKTVAVLGCGVDIIYPSENTKLYNDICLNGTVISEYAPGTSPSRFTFPQRNRIISGLSLGTLIIEAQIKSGAMITAKLAKEQGRDLFALPGRVGEANSLGPNDLIKNGAFAVNSARDVLKKYEFLYPDKIDIGRCSDPTAKELKTVDLKPFYSQEKKTTEEPNIPELWENDPIDAPSADKLKKYDLLPDDQKNICILLSESSPLTAEDISNGTKVSVSDTMSSLTILEIQGIVKAMPGGTYVLS